MTNATPDLRRQIRAAAAELLPPQHVDETVDLALHAFHQAFTTIGEITRRGSIVPVEMCALSIALSLIAGEAKSKLELLKEVAPKFGAKVTVVQAGGAHG